MKFQRHSLILDIIERETIETQEQLSRRLKELGVHVTQATVSRDIKELHLIKVSASNGKYRYAGSSSDSDGGFGLRFRTIFRESIIHVDCASNIIVVKTLTGVASAACAAIDAMKLPDIVGSLAGDDTLLLVMRTSEKAVDFSAEIKKLMK